MLKKFATLLLIPAISFAKSPYSDNELAVIKPYLLANIATSDHPFVKQDNQNTLHSKNGAVLASPSGVSSVTSQDYAFHWTRDAAIVMNELVSQYSIAKPAEKKSLKPYLLNYIEFERAAQLQPSNVGEETLGQPKFNIDTTVFEGQWGRPQNDGPALRALAITRIATILIDEGDLNWVQDHLIEMIKLDLDYVTTHWNKPNYDLWEEVLDGDHFFTKMVQRKSLLEAAKLLTKLNHHNDALKYEAIANEITHSLENHWDESRGYISETIYQQNNKGGGLDSAIILGVLYGDLNDENDAFAVTNDKVMSSVYFIRNAFASLYKININNANKPPLIGRYPNDIYDGNKFINGNPWPLLTNELARYYYACANKLKNQGVIYITNNNILFFNQIKKNLVKKPGRISKQEQSEKFNEIIAALKQEGDAVLANAKLYAVCYEDKSCLHFNEQIDRSSGKPASVKDLTWGYATVLAAMRERVA